MNRDGVKTGESERMKRPGIGWTVTAALISAGCMPKAPGVRVSSSCPEPAVVLASMDSGEAPETGADGDIRETKPASPPGLAPAPRSAEMTRELLTGPQSSEACARRALEENRGVRASWHRIQAAMARVPQASALADPMVENEVQPISARGQQLVSGYMPWSLSVTQQFPWFGVRPLRVAAAEREVAVAVQNWHQTQLDAIAQVKRAYAELSRTARSLRVLDAIRAQLKASVEIARIRSETRSEPGVQRDYFLARQALEDLERETAQLRDESRRALAALNRQLHQPPDTELTPLAELSIAPPPERLQELEAQALRIRPDLQATLAEIDRNRILVRLAELKGKPDVTLGLVYQLMTAQGALSPIADGKDNIGFVVGWSLPVHRGKIAGGVAEAQALAAAESLRLEDQQDQALAEVADRCSAARAATEIRDLIRDRVLPQSQRAREAAENDYRAGQGTLDALNSATRDVLRTRLEIIRQEAELAKAVAALEQAIGGSLHPRTEIEIETDAKTGVGEAKPDR